MPTPYDWIPASTPELLAALDKFLTALNNAPGQAASGVSAAQFTALATARADLQTAFNDRVTKEAALRAAVDAQQTKQAAAVAQLRTLGRAANNALAMTDTLRNQAGLTVRDRRPSPAPLPTTSDLSVVGRPSGHNFLDWSGPTGGSLRYLVYSRRPADTDWTLIGAASGTDFLHRDAGAGVARIYRAVAQRGKREGEPGNEASVYAGA